MTEPTPQEESKPMTKSQLKDFITGVMKDAGMHDKAALIDEAMEKSHAAWEEKTETQKAAHLAAERRNALYGNPSETKAMAGRAIASLIPSLMAGQCEKGAALKHAQERGLSEAVCKGLEASTFEDGGLFVPQEYADDFIELLRDRTVVRALGANTIEMGSGTLRFGKQNVGTTVGWLGEAKPAKTTQPKYKDLELRARKLAAIVIMTNDLIKYAGAGIESMVQLDLLAAIGEAEDVKYIRGDGTQNTPMGIYHWIKASQKFDANATADLKNVTTDLIKAMYKVNGNKIPRIRRCWMMASRVEHFLMTLRTDDGWPVFLDSLMNGQLWGTPVGITDSIPVNLSSGGDADETEVYYGDMAQAVIGQTGGVQTKMAEEAVVVNNQGEEINLFQTDQRAMRIITASDFLVRHDSAFSVIEKCKWGKSFGAL